MAANKQPPTNVFHVSFNTTDKAGYMRAVKVTIEEDVIFLDESVRIDLADPHPLLQRPAVLRQREPAMKHLTQAEFDDLTTRAAANTPCRPLDVLRAAQALATDARRLGVVLTISQRPLQPLAMGNHEDVVEIRETRP